MKKKQQKAKEVVTKKIQRKEEESMKALIAERVLDENDKKILEDFVKGLVDREFEPYLRTPFFSESDENILSGLNDYRNRNKLSDYLSFESILDIIETRYSSFSTIQSRESFRQNIVDMVESPKDKNTLLLLAKMLTIFGYIKDSVLEEIKVSVKHLTQTNSNYNNIINNLLDIHFGIFKEVNTDLNKIEQELNNYIYGMEEVKQRILNILALTKESKKSLTMPMLLYGPPGVGKTVFASVLAKVLGLPFYRINFSSSYDRSYLKGSNRTWSNSDVGEFTRILKKAKCFNPVIQFDEIDKAGGSSAGNFLDTITEILDPDQRIFKDDFLSVSYDLSAVYIICTANYLEKVPDYIKDRCEIIEVKEYSKQEKCIIIRDYMTKQIVSKWGLGFDIEIKDIALEQLSEIGSLRKIQVAIENMIGMQLRKRKQNQKFDKLVLDDASEIVETYLPKNNETKPFIGFGR